MRRRQDRPTARALRLGLTAVIGASLAIVTVGVAAPSASASSLGYGVLVQNETTNPVFIAEGSNPACLNNQGGVPGLGSGHTLQQGQNNLNPSSSDQGNAITLEFTTSNNGSCATSNNDWSFPFVVYVNNVQYAETVVDNNSQALDNGNTDTCTGTEVQGLDYGTMGVLGMACYRAGGNAGSTTTINNAFLFPNPLVVYASGFDILFNATKSNGSTTGGSDVQSGTTCTYNQWHSCVTVQVVPDGTSFSTPPTAYRVPSSDVGTARSALLTSASASQGMLNVVTPLPRQDIFGSDPEAGKAVERMRSGRLTVGTQIILGSAASALLTRVGADQVNNRVALSAVASSGGRTFSAQERHALPSGNVTDTMGSTTETVTLSKAATSRLCAAVAGGKAANIALSGKQYIGEPDHTYEMDVTKQVTLKTCPKG